MLFPSVYFVTPSHHTRRFSLDAIGIKIPKCELVSTQRHRPKDIGAGLARLVTISPTGIVLEYSPVKGHHLVCNLPHTLRRA